MSKSGFTASQLRGCGSHFCKTCPRGRQSSSLQAEDGEHVPQDAASLCDFLRRRLDLKLANCNETVLSAPSRTKAGVLQRCEFLGVPAQLAVSLGPPLIVIRVHFESRKPFKGSLGGV